MKKEEDYQQTKLRPYQIDPTRGLSSGRSKKYIRNDEAIRTLIQNYNNDPVKTDQKLITHLNALQYHLASKGFENWN